MKNQLIYLLLFVLIPLNAIASTEMRVDVVNVTITGGNTQERAVRKRLSVHPEAVYSSLDELQGAVDQDVQELINLDIFLEVRAFIILKSNSNFTVTYEIEDANTFVPIPLVIYDSNDGGFQVLYIQIWDNVMGGLINWFNIANITLRSNGSGGVETGPWLFSPKISKIPAGKLEMSIQYEQERIESSRFYENEPISSYRFDRSALFVEFEYRMGEKKRLYYRFSPGVELQYAYEDFLGSGTFSKTPLGISIKQELFYDAFNEYYNSRRGLKTGIINSLRIVKRDNRWKPVVDFTGEISYSWAFGDRARFSYYPRLVVFTVFNDTYEKIGEDIRGIPDVTMDGNFAIYLNQTIGISLWRWKGVWDLQFHPWFDLALAIGGTRKFNGFDDIRRSVGADLLIFIEKVPNLAFRFSWGMDLNADVPWGEENKTEFIVRYGYSY